MEKAFKTPDFENGDESLRHPNAESGAEVIPINRLQIDQLRGQIDYAERELEAAEQQVAVKKAIRDSLIKRWNDLGLLGRR